MNVFFIFLRPQCKRGKENTAGSKKKKKKFYPIAHLGVYLKEMEKLIYKGCYVIYEFIVFLSLKGFKWALN